MNNLAKIRKDSEDMIVLINRAERSKYDYEVTRANVLYGNSNSRKKWQKLLLVDAFPKLTMKKRVSKLTDVDLNI